MFPLNVKNLCSTQKIPELPNDLKAMIGMYADVATSPVAKYLYQQDAKGKTLRGVIGGYSPSKYLELFNPSEAKLTEIARRNDPKEIKLLTELDHSSIPRGKYKNLYLVALQVAPRLAYLIGLIEPWSLMVKESIIYDIGTWLGLVHGLYPDVGVYLEPFYKIAANIDITAADKAGKSMRFGTGFGKLELLNPIFNAALENEDYDQALIIGRRVPEVLYHDGYNPISDKVNGGAKGHRIINFILDNFFTKEYGYDSWDQGQLQAIDALTEMGLWDLASKAITKAAETSYESVYAYTLEHHQLYDLFDVLNARYLAQLNTPPVKDSKDQTLLQDIVDTIENTVPNQSVTFYERLLESGVNKQLLDDAIARFNSEPESDKVTGY